MADRIGPTRAMLWMAAALAVSLLASAGAAPYAPTGLRVRSPHDTSEPESSEYLKGVDANNAVTTAIGSSSIRVDWNDTGRPPDAQGYAVWRSRSGAAGSYLQANTAPLQTPTFTDTGLEALTTYFYIVYLVEASGALAQWTPVCFCTTREATVGPPTVENLAAQNITARVARLPGLLSSTGGENPNVWICWGATDGGTQGDAWQHFETLGPREGGPFQADLSNLEPATGYFFRCYAQNSAGGDWADASASFVTESEITTPGVSNSPATTITATSAYLNAEVLDSGGEAPEVRLYWGLADAGENAGAWEHRIDLGIRQVGPLEWPLENLEPNTPHYYRCWASNSAGAVWGESATSFTTAYQASIAIPSLDPSTATQVAASEALVTGYIHATGNETPSLRIYWGKSDAGASPEAWENVLALGLRESGPFTGNIGPLAPRTVYFLRAYAETSAGGAWENASVRFETAPSDSVWVDFSRSAPPWSGEEGAPYATVTEGLESVAQGGTIRIVGNSTVLSTSETLRITKPIRIEVVNGVIRIGVAASAQ